MNGASYVRKAHPKLVRALRCVESVDDQASLSVADDFVAQGGLTEADFRVALAAIDAVLGNPDVSNADIKGLLNGIDAWQYDSPFGADAKAARKHLEASREAIAAWIDR